MSQNYLFSLYSDIKCSLSNDSGQLERRQLPLPAFAEWLHNLAHNL